ncbi:EamA family transporter [Achromobacter sp. GG226]|uniref:EamA family transporter n=1 Tax=Verticiella alkaliphila TaxID=2779529 RepID=UPI001C0DBD5C|nr:EamA family transporter [Verticiella sp. GG226]MBU4611010.1 EamA family transporter [Verticiella sp. GG226]
MSTAVFVIVLCAALSNALWNAIVKASPDKLGSTMLVTLAGAVVALLILPWLEPPARESWPFLGISTLLQTVYFVFVANAYRVADMSQVYPIMRGTAPLVVALVSLAWIGEPMPAMAWVGIAVICLGIFGMAADARRANRRGLVYALSAAAVIASFTIIDGLGVRRSGAPLSYTLWIFVLTGPPFLVWALLARRRDFGSYLAAHWRLGLVGGIATIISYALTLWAMTQAPVAMVAALRETAILFGVAISALVLSEHVTRARLMAVAIIAAGAALLRLA